MTNQVISISESYENVKYFGSFKNPDDLSSINNKVDLVVACYDIQSLNERIAEPNKMYEAMYFKTPIIVTTGTYLEKQVKKYGCGFSINATTNENIINFINSLTNNKLNKVKTNIEKVDSAELIDDNAKNIIDKLENFVH